MTNESLITISDQQSPINEVSNLFGQIIHHFQHSPDDKLSFNVRSEDTLLIMISVCLSLMTILAILAVVFFTIKYRVDHILKGFSDIKDENV